MSSRDSAAGNGWESNVLLGNVPPLGLPGKGRAAWREWAGPGRGLGILGFLRILIVTFAFWPWAANK